MPNISDKYNYDLPRTTSYENKIVPKFDEIARVAPIADIFDDPIRCYRINEEWAGYVMGWVAWLARPSAWVGADNELSREVQSILKFKIGDNCPMYQLRQNPTDPCQLQQSLDEGETWQTIFDYSLCLSIVDGQSQISQDIYNNTVNQSFNESFNQYVTNIYEYYENNYINTVGDVAPELVYGDGDDSFRDDGLCYAIQELVDETCEAAFAFFDNLDETVNDLRLQLALGAAVLGILALAASGIGTPAAVALAGQMSLVAAGVGLGSAIATDLYNHFSATNRSAYEDVQAREDVVCCIYNQLAGANVDKDDFINVSTCGTLTTNGDAIFEAVSKMFFNDAGYASFTERNRIGFNSAKAGLLPACPCQPENDSYYQDFALGAGDWTIDAGNLGGGGITSVPSGQPEAIVISLRSATAWAMNGLQIIYTRQSDGSFIDDLRIIGWSNIDTGTGRVDVYERDEPVTGQTQITLCIDTLSTAKRNDWGIYLRDNNAGATITLEEIKVWSDIDPVPQDITVNAVLGC